MIALTFTMEEPITYNLQTFKKQIEARKLTGPTSTMVDID